MCVCVCVCLSVIISLCSGLFLCTVMQYIGFVGVFFCLSPSLPEYMQCFVFLSAGTNFSFFG